MAGHLEQLLASLGHGLLLGGDEVVGGNDDAVVRFKWRPTSLASHIELSAIDDLKKTKGDSVNFASV